MTLILRLLLKVAPLLLLYLLARAARLIFQTAERKGPFGDARDAPPRGKRNTGKASEGTGGKSRKDPYAVLECSPSSSDEEIKRKYRELLGKYHPDKFIGQQLDKEFVELASRKFQEIQEAYGRIRAVRGF